MYFYEQLIRAQAATVPNLRSARTRSGTGRPPTTATGSPPTTWSGMAAFANGDISLEDCQQEISQAGVMHLDAPEIVLPKEGDPVLSLSHWLASEPLLDGGNLEVTRRPARIRVSTQSQAGCSCTTDSHTTLPWLLLLLLPLARSRHEAVRAS